MEPRNIYAWYQKAHGFRQLNRFNQALECYSKVIAIDPSYNHRDHSYHLELGREAAGQMVLSVPAKYR